METQGVEPMSYADDLGITTASGQVLQEAIDVTAEFDKLTKRPHSGKT
jgi:hypothetical protein